MRGGGEGEAGGGGYRATGKGLSGAGVEREGGLVMMLLEICWRRYHLPDGVSPRRTVGVRCDGEGDKQEGEFWVIAVACDLMWGLPPGTLDAPKYQDMKVGGGALGEGSEGNGETEGGGTTCQWVSLQCALWV